MTTTTTRRLAAGLAVGMLALAAIPPAAAEVRLRLG